jgi:hypothetical protein
VRAAVLAVFAAAAAAVACGPSPPPLADPRGGLPATVRTVAIGDPVASVWVEGPDGRPEERALDAGPAATVIWFSSCTCKCVAQCEERIRALIARYESKGLRFLAIDSNPFDTREDIADLRARIGAPYAIERDVNGFTMRTLGIRASASVAVLDGRQRLRYRGAIDDDLDRPTTSYVHRAVDAILAGVEFEPVEVVSYGCVYPKPEE